MSCYIIKSWPLREKMKSSIDRRRSITSCKITLRLDLNIGSQRKELTRQIVSLIQILTGLNVVKLCSYFKFHFFLSQSDTSLVQNGPQYMVERRQWLLLRMEDYNLNDFHLIVVGKYI